MSCFVNFYASVTMGTLVCQALPAHPCGYADRELEEAIKHMVFLPDIVGDPVCAWTKAAGQIAMQRNPLRDFSAFP